MADLSPGESQIFTATYTLSAGDATAIAGAADSSIAIENTASATGTPVSGALPVIPDSTVTTGPAAVAGLSVTKSSTAQSFSDPVAASDTVTYEFIVTNTGNVDITDAAPVDSGVFVDGVAGTGTLGAFSPLTAIIAPGASATFSATYTLSAGDAAAVAASSDPENAISNAATATGTAPGTTPLPPVTQTPPVTTGPVPAPELTVAKTVTTVLTDMPAVGDQLVYNVNVSNTGNVNIDDVNATDPGPSFNGVLGAGALVIVPQNIDLIPDANQDFTVTYTITQTDIDNLAAASDTSTAIDNTANASGLPVAGTLPAPTPSAVQTGIAAEPNLSVVKTSTGDSFSSPLAANDTVAYQFVVTNTGNVDIAGAVPVDGVSGVQIDGANGTGVLSAFDPVSADLSPGESQIFTATYTLSASDATAIAGAADSSIAIENTASATGTPVSGALPVIPDSTVTTGPAAVAGLSVTKSSTAQSFSDPVAASDTVTYEFIVTNTGNVDITDAAPVDSGVFVDGVAGTGTLGAFSPLTAIIAPGASATFSATYTLSAGDAAAVAASSDPENAISNAATATGTPPGTTPLPPVTQTPPVTTGPVPAPELTVAKTVTTVLTDMPAVGDQLVYNVNVSNTGNVNIDDVNATDPGPSFNGVLGAGALVISPQNIDLIPDANQDFTVTYTITQTDIDNLAAAADTASAIDNSASASGAPTSGTLPAPTPSAVQTGIAAGPNLSVVKTSTGDSFSSPLAANDTVAYQFVVTNTGNVDITGAVPTDGGVQVDGAAGTGSLSAFDPLSADLAPGESQIFTATYTLSAGDGLAIAGSTDPATAIVNTASATGTPVSGALPVIPDSTVTTGPAAVAGLSVTKSSTAQSFSDPVAASDTVTYEFIVTNTGNVDITNAAPVDSGVFVDGVAGTGTLGAFSPLTAIIAPGASATFSATYTLSAGDAAAVAASSDPENAISNAATATGTAPGTTPLPPVTQTPPVTTGPVPAPELTVAKTVTTVLTDMPAVGDQLVYNVNVSNTGNVNIDDVNATDPGPSFNGVLGAGALVIVPQNIDLIPDANQDFTVTYTITQTDIDNLAAASDTASAIDNSASASGAPTSGTLPAPTPSAVQTGIAAGPNLSVVKTSTGDSFSSPLAANDTVAYQFVVTNTGNVNIAGAVPVDGISGVQVDGAAGTGSLSAFDPLSADLAPGESQIFTATYTLSAGDGLAIAGSADSSIAIENTASATGTPVSGALPVIPDSTVTTGPAAVAGLSVTKSSTAQSFSDPVAASDTVTYEFIVTNTGNVDITDAAPVDSGVFVDGVAGTGTLGAFSPLTAIIAPGASATFSATYTLSAGDAAAVAASSDPENAISNAATATGTPPGTTPLPPVTQTPPVTTGPVPAPELTVAKTVTTVLTNMPSVGDQLVYNVNVSNTGNVNIDDVNATDPGPSFNGVLGAGALVISPQNIDLIPDANQDFTVTYTITQTDIDNLAAASDTANAIDNSASASGLPVAGTLPAPTPSAVQTGIAAGPNLSVVKTSTGDSFSSPLAANDTVAYQFVVTNTGNVDIAGAVPVDGVSGVQIDGAAGTGSLSAFDPLSADLSPGESQIFTATYTLSAGDGLAIAGSTDPATAIANTASATGTPVSGALPVIPDSTVTTGPAAVAGLSVTKSSTAQSFSDPVAASDTVTYEFIVTNTGNVDITDAAPVDSGVFVDGVAGTGTLGAFSPLTAIIAPGASATFSATYTLSAGDAAAVAASSDPENAISNAATATGTAPGTTPLPPVTETPPVTTGPVPAPELTVAKTVTTVLTDMPAVGDQLVYNVNVSNTGNVNIDDVNATDPGPSFNAVLGTGALVISPQNIDLIPDANQDFTVTYTITQTDIDNLAAASDTASAIDNSASASGAPTSGTLPAPTPSAVETGIAAAPQLGVVKSAEVGALKGDGTFDVTYSILVMNTGNVELSNLTLVDDLTLISQLGSAFNGVEGEPVVSPINIGALSVLPLSSGATYNGTNDLINGAAAVLTPGDSFEVGFKVNVNPNAANAPEVLANMATASGTSPGSAVAVSDNSDAGTDEDGNDNGADPSDNPGGPGTPTIVKAPQVESSLIVSKELSGPPTDLGGGVYQVIFNISAVNDGNVDMANVQIVEDLIAMTNDPVASGATVENAVVAHVGGTTLTANGSFTGTGANNMVDPTGASRALAVGETSNLTITFEFTPAQYFGPFNNVVVLSGTDPLGVVEVDNSENGAVPVSTGGNGDFQSVTPFQLSVPSTPISLGWFHAEGNPNGTVAIRWQTATEVGNAGFNISVEDENGDWVKMNETMLVSQGDSDSAQDYEYVVVTDSRQFLLTDIGVTGKDVVHGPFMLNELHGLRSASKDIDWNEINVESENKKMLREEQRKQELQRKLDALKNLQSNSGPSSDGASIGSYLGKALALMLSAIVPSAEAVNLVTFEVETPGIYEVSHLDLMDAGLDLQGFNIDRLGLKVNRDLWPLKIESSGSAVFTSESKLMFAGRGLDTLYSGKNKYVLVLDEGQLVIEDDNSAYPGSEIALASSYFAEKVYAPQNEYSYLSPEGDDSWYADYLSATSEPVSKSVTFNVTDYKPSRSYATSGSGIQRQPTQNPKLEVSVWGGSALPGNGALNPDHQILVDFNSSQVADAKFDGMRSHLEVVSLPSIANGSNTIKVTVPNKNGQIYDLIQLDHIILKYPRRFEANDSGKSLVFTSGWSKFRITDLDNDEVVIVRVDSSGNAHFMTERGAGNCIDTCVYFAGSDTSEEDTYFVATAAGFKKPSISVALDDGSISSGPAKYVVIAHPDFINTPAQLLESYVIELIGTYGTAELVAVDSIYAKYTGGVVDASAINDYIEDAYYDKDTRHVLLVGGDMYDYRDYTNSGAKSFIPSIYTQIAENVSSVPSDSSYTLIDDDLVPDMTIARLPVRTTQELQLLIDKRTKYLARNYGNKAVFVADELDPSNYSFQSDSERLVFDHFGGWTSNEVYLDSTTISAAQSTITTAINSGVGVISYFGHSATDRWSISGMFTGDNVDNLSNFQKPTVVTQWGCWNTFYVSPENDSMAHRFLLSGQQGAVTVMGASSFTQATAEKRMAGFLFGHLKTGMSIGDAVLAAKQEIAITTPYQVDVLLGWAVLGFDDMSIFP